MSSLGIFNKETKTYQKVAGTAEAAVVDAEMSDTSTNTVQNKVVKKYVDEHAPNITVDDVLSSTSTNPVQNKVVTSNLTDIRKETTVNLLKPTLQTSTIDGVTCTNNGDGTYTLNGTCSVNSEKTTIILTSESMKIDEDVKFICCTRSGSRDTFRASVDYDDGTYSVDYGEGTLLSKGKTITKASMIVSNGVTVNNLVFKPMLTTDLNATYDDFVPYTGDTGRLNWDVAELNKTVDTLKKSVLALQSAQSK